MEDRLLRIGNTTQDYTVKGLPLPPVEQPTPTMQAISDIAKIARAQQISFTEASKIYDAEHEDVEEEPEYLSVYPHNPRSVAQVKRFLTYYNNDMDDAHIAHAMGISTHCAYYRRKHIYMLPAYGDAARKIRVTVAEILDKFAKER